VFHDSYLTIMVRDLDRAVRFYTEVVGLPLRFRAGNHWAEVQAPGVKIGLHPAPVDSVAPPGSGTVSLGLQVADLDVAVAELSQRGITFGPLGGRGGPRQTRYFANPDGTVLYLIQMEDGAR
jgi:catechol 2,3-dioxygenase-like lactoylglutathione lyase family enzyme